MTCSFSVVTRARRNDCVVAALGSKPSTRPELSTWPVNESARFARSEVTALIGHGEHTWQRASNDVLHWAVKTRSGFEVADASRVTPGAEREVTMRIAGATVREPVRVAVVVESDTRVGFSYQTLPGHPVTGEEAFIVHRDANDVFLTIRSLTAPSDSQPWRMLYPLLRGAQLIVRRRYLRALR